MFLIGLLAFVLLILAVTVFITRYIPRQPSLLIALGLFALLVFGVQKYPPVDGAAMITFMLPIVGIAELVVWHLPRWQSFGIAFGLFAFLFSSEAKNPWEVEYSQPLSYWADPQQAKDQDPCVYATAQAIIKSGLPYPNFGIETIQRPDGTQATRNSTVDVWVGNTRFVLPAQLVSSNGAYPLNRPERFWTLHGSLPHLWPAGEPGPVVDGMGSMVDITIRCSVRPEHVASWGKGYRSNAEGIEKVKRQYEQRLKNNQHTPGRVTISVRQDLGMTEVLLDRMQEKAKGRHAGEVGYWPINKELKGPSGDVVGIGCDTQHDVQKRYENMKWRCRTTLPITPEATALIDIYITQLQHAPTIFEQVRQLFEAAQQPH